MNLKNMNGKKSLPNQTGTEKAYNPQKNQNVNKKNINLGIVNLFFLFFNYKFFYF